MTFIGEKDFGLEVALGNVPRYGREMKFGKAPDVGSAVVTDIWDGADAVTSTPIWIPPTTARIHDIVSTSVADTSAGTGLRTVRVSGLTSFTTAEESETITLNGTTNVPTVKSWVIIHRLESITFGSGATNAGIITATAQTDATITAAMQAGFGQSLMAIYGVPSTKRMNLTLIDASALKGGVAVTVDITFVVNERADQADSGFITKFIFSTESAHMLSIDPPLPVPGPAILKLQAESDQSNAAITGAFNGYLVDL